MHGSLGDREEHGGVDRSQETCLFVKMIDLRATDPVSDSTYSTPPSGRCAAAWQDSEITAGDCGFYFYKKGAEKI